jgi:hypothetical protein
MKPPAVRPGLVEQVAVLAVSLTGQFNRIDWQATHAADELHF